MTTPSEITADIELGVGLLLFFMVIATFMMADVQSTNNEVLDMIVQLLHESTKESEKVIVIVGGLKYWSVGMMVKMIELFAYITGFEKE